MLRLTALLLLSATGHCFQLSHVPRTPALRSRPILASVAEQPPPPDESEEEKRARLARCTEARTPDLCATACVHAMGSVPVQEAIGREAAAEKNYLDSAPADDGGLMAEFQARIDAEGGANVFKAKSAANDVTEQAKEAANKAKAAASGVADSAKGLASGFTQQQRDIALVIFGLIAFQILVGFIGNAMSGGGGGMGGGPTGYTV